MSVYVCVCVYIYMYVYSHLCIGSLKTVCIHIYVCVYIHTHSIHGVLHSHWRPMGLMLSHTVPDLFILRWV